ncbi:TPA: RtcB family protein, partial [Clostridioides difficile]|nr:RtcB family protein [Clostridioides difficile]
SMKEIFTTCVGQSTLDEAPQAYKPIEDILNNIGDTIEIMEVLKPVYNFKSN